MPLSITLRKTFAQNGESEQSHNVAVLQLPPSIIKWHGRILFSGPDHEPLCHFLLEPMTDALLFCCGQFEAIFCQYTFVSKFQFSGPLESIWTHDINFLLRIEWILWKNMIFFVLGPKKGFFGGINRFNPQYFWPIILPNFFGGAIYRPLRT